MKLALLTVAFLALSTAIVSIMTRGNSYEGLTLPFFIVPALFVFQAIVFYVIKFPPRKN